jgi:homoserine kinase type II
MEALARGGFEVLDAEITLHPGDEHAGPGRRWLEMARSALPWVLPALRDASRLEVPLLPCLRDARPDHFLFQGERLSGLVDFGAMGIDCVAADLARLFGEWFHDSGSLPAGALAAYEQVRPLDKSESALVTHFLTSADVLIAGHWLSWHFLKHRRFDDPGAVGTGIARGLARLERLITPRLRG